MVAFEQLRERQVRIVVDAEPVDRGRSLSDRRCHRVAMFVFVVMSSGVTMAEIGWPFLGVLAGVAALVIASWGTHRREWER